MPDLIPEGSISLRAMYKRVVKAFWTEDSPLSDTSCEQRYGTVHPWIAAQSRARLASVKNRLLSDLVAAFANGTLDAFVRRPDSDENYTIPPDSWDSVFFPERAFLSPEIAQRHGGYWDSLVGRTPFVRRSQFDAWLEQQVRGRNDPRAKLSPANQALKEYLIGLAMDGVMSSTEAEDLARRWGLPPIASSADYIDPMRLSRWTLCMAVAWIIWGDLDAVREAMDDYCANSWEWVPCSRQVQVGGDDGWCKVDGEELIPLRPSSITLLGIAEATNSDAREAAKRVSIKTAREQLWQYLGESKIVAAGSNLAGELCTIEAHEWSYLTLAGRRHGPDYLVLSSYTLEKAYTDVTMAREGLIALWPPSIELPALEIELLSPRISVQRKRGKVEATRHAVAALYPDGVPAGPSDKQLLDEVNGWLGKQGRSKVMVSITTLRRVINKY